MSIWVYDSANNAYSAEFPTADGRRYTITVSEDEFADVEFKNGNGEFLPLKEGRFYHYEISGGGRLADVSSFLRGGGGNAGRLAPGTAVGFGRLWLEGHTDPSEALDVEVVSDIIGYKDDYNKLLAQLTGYVADLQMQCASDVQYLVGVDEEKTPETELQQFFFLVGIVNDNMLEQALRRIVESPYVCLQTAEAECDIRHATRFSAAMLRQIASGVRRVEAPQALRERIATLPERLRGVVREETTDIPENRFVKHVLTTFRGGLQNFKDKIREGKLKAKADKLYAIELDVKAGLERLDFWLSTDFFRGVGPLTSMPSSSVVLQRREGYRDILRKWLQSQAAATMKWAAGVDAYRENQKDVATLYEYWCFFRLLDIIKDLFDIEPEEIYGKIVDIGQDGLSLKIREGKQLDALEGRYVSGHTSHRYRRLTIEYQYNRRFTQASGKSSWTMTMIPDYTISFRPQGMSVADAERLDLISYVHFDAKYKAKDIVEKLEAAVREGAVEEETNEEEKSAKDVKRVDILKMHAYRDSIPRTAGAYVLYPGTKDRTYRYGDEILPGLGAFPLYPKDDNSDDEPIKEFLSSVAEYLCDRITRWENFTYQKNLAFAGTQKDWGRYQAVIAHRYKYAENVGDVVHGVRDNLSYRENLALIPPGRFLSITLGNEPKEKYSRDKQALWLYEHNLFVKSSDQALDCDPEDLLMITAMWYPPFSMMVKRYCGKKTRAELEFDGKGLPFPARNDTFHVWEIALCNFNHVKEYLTSHNI